METKKCAHETYRVVNMLQFFFLVSETKKIIWHLKKEGTALKLMSVRAFYNERPGKKKKKRGGGGGGRRAGICLM